MPGNPVEAPEIQKDGKRHGQSRRDGRKIVQEGRKPDRPVQDHIFCEQNQNAENWRKKPLPEDPVDDSGRRPMKESGIPEPNKVWNCGGHHGSIFSGEFERFDRGHPEGPSHPTDSVQEVAQSNRPEPPDAKKTFQTSTGNPIPDRMDTPITGFAEEKV